MKRAVLLVAGLLAAVPAAAQTSLLPTVQRIRAEYPTPMSARQLGELLNRVAWEHRLEGWGLLRKAGGHRCPAPQEVDISCDILIHAPSIRHFDVLSDVENSATPVWRDVGPCVLGPSSGCDMSNYLAPIRPAQSRMTSGDFDGDGMADHAVFRPSDGGWRVFRSGAGSQLNTAWGTVGDIPLSGDFDGDRIGDMVAFRPSNGRWYILVSSNGFNPAGSRAYTWGAQGDIPLIADYDADGRSDLTVFRPSDGRWYIWFSRNNYQPGDWGSLVWGGQGDQPLSGDVDGDSRSDIVVFRESTGEWFGLLSSTGYSQGGSIKWGGAGDRPVPADYDGDGVPDFAVFRPSDGNWYLWMSRGNFPTTNRATIRWGAAGDHPYPGDFDGDGRADIAVWRPSDGVWYVLNSSTGYTIWTVRQLGASGDLTPRLR
jgi:hypothetical protein